MPEGMLDWVKSRLAPTFDLGAAGLTVVAGDASNRRYFRLQAGLKSCILVDAPPATEKNEAFVATHNLLHAAGVRVPGMLHADLERGFFLLEDLGDQLLLAQLDGSDTRCYTQAVDVLLDMADIDMQGRDWPAYDQALLSEELSRFSEWFVTALLQYKPDPDESAVIARFAGFLVDAALQQPRVLVHRDFHSRNLMPQLDGSLAVIDFQDAVVGPISYDVVSLLRDCYKLWPDRQVQAWALDYCLQLQRRGHLQGVSPAQFLRWFDLMGLQRHIKVLGTFARLYLRDAKPGYLSDLSLVVHYVRQMLDRYQGDSPVAAFGQWFEATLMPQISAQDWWEPLA
jgi:N-acetylmuramate 1-kinase